MIYFDNSATTRVSDNAAKKAMYIMTECFGNPSSLHSLGFKAELEIKNARKIIANALSCREGEIYFTSGGTEANNTAIIGTARANARRGNKIVISATEHSSVLAAADYLEQNGFEITRIFPDKNGEITPESVAAAVDDKTVLVSVMLVNNELGTINDVATIAAASRRKNNRTIIHCDAVQAFGKIPVHCGKLGVDLLSVSAHKIHGPKGSGALFCKKGTKIHPIIFGGEQQNKFRPGTENAAGICAFAAACSDALKNMAKNYAHARELSAELRSELLKIEGIELNSKENALPYIVNFSTNAVKSETLTHYMEARDIYISGGSACAKGNRSHVLSACGFSDKRIDTAIRVSFSEENKKEDISVFIDALKSALDDLQKIK